MPPFTGRLTGRVLRDTRWPGWLDELGSGLGVPLGDPLAGGRFESRSWRDERDSRGPAGRELLSCARGAQLAPLASRLVSDLAARRRDGRHRCRCCLALRARVPVDDIAPTRVREGDRPPRRASESNPTTASSPKDSYGLRAPDRESTRPREAHVRATQASPRGPRYTSAASEAGLCAEAVVSRIDVAAPRLMQQSVDDGRDGCSGDRWSSPGEVAGKPTLLVQRGGLVCGRRG